MIRLKLFPLFLLPYLCLGQSILPDSIQEQIDSFPDSLKAQQWHKWAESFTYSHPDLAEQLAQRGIQQARKEEQPTWEAKCYFVMGNLWLDRENQDSASQYANQTKTLAQELGMAQLESDALLQLSAISRRQGAFEKAGEYAYEALQIKEAEQDSAGIAQTYVILANTYILRRLYDEALSFLQQALEIYQALGEEDGIASTHGSMGVLYDRLKQYGSAETAYRKALTFFTSVEDQNRQATAYANIGFVKIMQQQFDKGNQLLDSAILIYRKLENLGGEVRVLIGKSLILDDMGQKEEALMVSEAAAQKAKATGDIPMLRVTYKNLRNDYYDLGRYQEAIEAMDLYTEIHDSLINERNFAQLEELRIKYETEKQEQTINRLTQQQEIDRLALLNQRNQILGLLILLILGVLTTFLFLQRNRLRARQRLNEAQLKQQSIRLHTTIETQEQERDRIARDLHDGLGQLLSAARMQLAAKSSNGPGTPPILTMLDDAVREVRTLAHSMMPQTLQEQGLVSAIQELIDKTEHPQKLRIQFDVHGLNHRLPQATEIGLYRILQELLNNVIKHAKASQIDILLAKTRDALLLTVEDDGVGIPGHLPQTGMGMHNIQTRTEALAGTFRIEAGPKRGTIATIKIPIRLNDE